MLKLNSIICAGIAGISLFAAEVSDAEFAKFQNGVLAAWKNTNNAKLAVENKVLTVTAVKKKLEDSIYQRQKIKPSDNLYVFSADVDAAVGRSAYVQIKLFDNKKELLRVNSKNAPAGKSRLTVKASHPDATYIEYAMRVNHNGAGKDFKFSNPALRLGDKSEISGPWLRGGKGFDVKFITDNHFEVTIVQEQKLHMAMFVNRRVKSGEKFLFEADYASDLPKMAYLEVKYFNKGRELKRKQSYSDAAQGKLSLEIDSTNCDVIVLQCRVPVAKAFVGKKVTFNNIKLKKLD